MRYLFLLLIFPHWLQAQPFTTAEVSRWKAQAKQVTIIRDNWGIPHVYGKTDADAVFGLLYAQCEDDFKRVEMNYIEKLGRLSEVKGEKELYNDLLIRLIIDSSDAVADYNKSPAWMKKLLNAFADGINYYLYANPSSRPLLLHRFKPWYPLLWTDGSIGAISTGGATVDELKNFYSGKPATASVVKKEREPGGSNGFAFAPSVTASGKAILYINPHVTFYFRPEVHMVSEEGLNVYGAVTWGQFFIYQGFNEKCGWMHTSSDVDVADLYAEQVNNSGEYQYEKRKRKLRKKQMSISYLQPDSVRVTKAFTAFYTHHGPVVAERNGKWIALRANNRSLTSLFQSWQRTKAKSFTEYKKTMELRSNTSNNTVYADAEGNIAYWHGNFIPRRNVRYNWSRPVDGTKAATEWQGLHTMEESVHLYNPVNGWLQNCNSTPFTAAGTHSPVRKAYPFYMAPDGENFRGINAVRVLSKQKSYTIDKVIAAGYDTYMAAFEKLIPALANAYGVAAGDTSFSFLKEPISLLQQWNLHASENSVATTLAVEWGTQLLPALQKNEEEDQVMRTDRFITSVRPADLLQSFAAVIKDLNTRFGSWQVPWASINRFQRISSDIDQKFDDTKPSIPVAFTSSTWGMLPSYTARYFPGTKKRYGVSGNSFVCAVEFGDRIKAKSLLAGGQSGNPASPHFTDQAEMYTKGIFKDVLFYKEDIIKNMNEQYHPGERLLSTPKKLRQ